MNEIKDTINRQLRQLQMLMHHTMFSHFGKANNPHRGARPGAGNPQIEARNQPGRTDLFAQYEQAISCRVCYKSGKKRIYNP